jgi:hypothetical protein
MSDPSPHEPENIYHSGYFPGLRARLGAGWRSARQLVLDPSVAKEPSPEALEKLLKVG